MTKPKHFYRFIMAMVMLTFLASASVFSEEENQDHSVEPLDGELLLPDDYSEADEKKCMTVCERWGEDCILNPRTGSRKCRRVCKSFAEECF